MRWEVDVTGSRLYPLAGFRISSVESFGIFLAVTNPGASETRPGDSEQTGGRPSASHHHCRKEERFLWVYIAGEADHSFHSYEIQIRCVDDICHPRLSRTFSHIETSIQ